MNAVRPLARDESAVFLLYLPTVYLFLQPFVRPGLNSCVLHSTCRWLQLPLVGDYSPLLYRLHIHPASVRLPDAQSAITLPRTVATLPRLGSGSACFRADLQVFSSAILNMPSLRPAVTSPLLPGIPVMRALRQ